MEKKIHEELVNTCIYGGESNTIEVPLAGQRPEHSRNSKDSSQYIMLYRACFQGNLVDPHHTSQTHRLTQKINRSQTLQIKIKNQILSC